MQPPAVWRHRCGKGGAPTGLRAWAAAALLLLPAVLPAAEGAPPTPALRLHLLVNESGDADANASTNATAEPPELDNASDNADSPTQALDGWPKVLPPPLHYPTRMTTEPPPTLRRIVYDALVNTPAPYPLPPGLKIAEPGQGYLPWKRRLLLASRHRRAGSADRVRDGASSADGQGSSAKQPLDMVGSMAYEFHNLDDLEPVAPMDNVSPAWSVTTLGLEPLPGEHHNSLYIPAYTHPDAFPAVAGAKCMCQAPDHVKVTEAQQEWANEVVKQLGLRGAESLTDNRVKCECSDGDDKGKPTAYHWMKVEPVPNSNNFTLVPADTTYGAGDYWAPRLKGGLAAPEDKLPRAEYPLQAVNDKIWPSSTVAREDGVPIEFARYMDQVEARSLRCDGDGVSERCVVDCRPGDQVRAQIFSTQFDAQIVSTHDGGWTVIEFVPAAARKAKSFLTCPVEARCSVFRPCKRRLNVQCVELQAQHPRDVFGNLQTHLACPAGTEVCGTVQQVVGAKFLSKDGKTCRPKGPKTKPDSARSAGGNLRRQLLD